MKQPNCPWCGMSWNATMAEYQCGTYPLCSERQDVQQSAACLEIARLRAIPDLIRKRYPRMLERGNPLFDGVLAALLERCADPASRLRAQVADLEARCVVLWEYCPECGSDRTKYEDGTKKFCRDCNQEWYSDIDYTDVVRQNLCEGKDVLRPSSRVLRDGEVAVDAKELQRLRDFADGWNSFREQFDDIVYHHQGMGCGIEDRGIHDRYLACEHGWESAMERVAERFPEIDTLDALRAQGKEGAP